MKFFWALFIGALFIFFGGQSVLADTPTFVCQCTSGSHVDTLTVSDAGNCTAAIQNPLLSTANGYSYSTCTLLPNYYCMCRSEAGGDCKETQINTAALPNPAPSDCDAFCQKTTGMERISLRAVPATDSYSSMENDPICYNHCWCQGADGTCTDNIKQTGGSAVFSKAYQCTVSCTDKQLKAVHYDDYAATLGHGTAYAGAVIDETKSAECQKKTAPPPAPPSGAGGAGTPTANQDKLAQLKAQAAQDLNRVQFTSPEQIIGQAIKFFIAFIGTIALVFYIYSGILWMSAMGNSEQIEKAKNIILWTTLGVGGILASSILAQFLFHDVLKVI